MGSLSSLAVMTTAEPYQFRDFIFYDHSKSLALLYADARSGSVAAQYEIAEGLYAKGDDWRSVEYWAVKAGEGGDQDAAILLTTQYLPQFYGGIAIPRPHQDQEKAVRWMDRLIQDDVPMAGVLQAAAYINGYRWFSQGFRTVLNQMERVLDREDLQDVERAAVKLVRAAFLVETGLSGAEGIRILRDMEGEGDSNAVFLLGLYQARVAKHNQNLATWHKALERWRQAAVKGHVIAAHHLYQAEVLGVDGQAVQDHSACNVLGQYRPETPYAAYLPAIYAEMRVHLSRKSEDHKGANRFAEACTVLNSFRNIATLAPRYARDLMAPNALFADDIQAYFWVRLAQAGLKQTELSGRTSPGPRCHRQVEKKIRSTKRLVAELGTMRGELEIRMHPRDLEIGERLAGHYIDDTPHQPQPSFIARRSALPDEDDL